MLHSCVLLGGFAIGARVVLLWQHNAKPSYKLASIPRYDDIVWTLGGVCARRWPVTGRRRGGVLNITTAACTAVFHWWRSGNITRTQNVSEYMLVLDLCLVAFVFMYANWFYVLILGHNLWNLTSLYATILISYFHCFCIYLGCSSVTAVSKITRWLPVLHK